MSQRLKEAISIRRNMGTETDPRIEASLNSGFRKLSAQWKNGDVDSIQSILKVINTIISRNTIGYMSSIEEHIPMLIDLARRSETIDEYTPAIAILSNLIASSSKYAELYRPLIPFISIQLQLKPTELYVTFSSNLLLCPSIRNELRDAIKIRTLLNSLAFPRDNATKARLEFLSIYTTSPVDDAEFIVRAVAPHMNQFPETSLKIIRNVLDCSSIDSSLIEELGISKFIQESIGMDCADVYLIAGLLYEKFGAVFHFDFDELAQSLNAYRSKTVSAIAYMVTSSLRAGDLSDYLVWYNSFLSAFFDSSFLEKRMIAEFILECLILNKRGESEQEEQILTEMDDTDLAGRIATYRHFIPNGSE